jgi:ceramide glucosyltransferase
VSALSLPQVVLVAVALLGLAVTAWELEALRRVRRRALPPPPRYPGISLLKPLRGLDEELELNLRSHLALEYPGEWEILLGVRGEDDPAYPLARAFAGRHPERVRLVLQEGQPGHNPKVNQLITLTRAARHEVIALTDSNVRVAPGYLLEVAATLASPGVGLATHLFAGVGERGLGAVLDNLTLAYFVATNLSASSLFVKMDNVVGKSMALRREVLERVGGWHAVKDYLAEDHVLGKILRRHGLRSALCPTPVQNVQIDQPLRHFWDRNSRWLMMRFRSFPGTWAEPAVLPALLTLAAALLSPANGAGWLAFAAAWAWDAAMVQVAARLLRGYGFRPWHLLLVPLREAVYFGAWVHGATMRRVEWRGNRLLVLGRTRLAEPAAVDRARNLRNLRKMRS